MAKKKLTKEAIISQYMKHTLEHEKHPTSVYSFCSDMGVEEGEFYPFFGSLNAVKTAIWTTFHEQTIGLISKQVSYDTMDWDTKYLSYLFTLVELLTLNRSYVVMSMNRNPMEWAKETKDWKSAFQHFVEVSEFGAIPLPETLQKTQEKAEELGHWTHLMMILNFWKKDESANFQDTDVMIEKSVIVLQKMKDTSLIESAVDLGKFIWSTMKSSSK